MKLPFLELKKIPPIKSERQIIYLRQNNNNLNNLVLPNNSISSILNNNYINYINNNLASMTNDYQRTQKNINELFYKKAKTKEKIKTKKFFLKNHINSFNDNISNNKINIYENNNDEYKYKKKYIKNPLDSFKIRNEISSFIYSNPQNQIRFIKYIMMNRSENKINDENINDKLLLPINAKKKTKIKLVKKNGETKKEKDEDKIHFKESSLFSLFFNNKNKDKNKDKNNNKTKYDIRNRNIKSIESWDNNLLKNILPSNIKNYYDYKYQNLINNNNYELNSNKKNKVKYYRNNGCQTINSIYTIRNATKYDFDGKYKKINKILLNKEKQDIKYKIKKNKKLTRSSSIC